MRINSVKYSTDQVSLTKHYHDMHQILFVTSGSISVTLGEANEVLNEGDMLILSRFEEHSIKVLSGQYSRYMLHISSEPSPTGVDNYLLSSVLVNRNKSFRHIICTKDKSKCFVDLFSKMKTEYDSDNPFCVEQLDFYFNTFLILLYRVSPEIFLSDTVNTSAVECIQKEFELNYGDDFSLASLAERYHLSVSHLSHIFKSVTGYSPIDYLTVCRLTAAKKYLATTKKPIKEIVDVCGFRDESNFSRMFRLKIGISPSEFRKQNFKKQEI